MLTTFFLLAQFKLPRDMQRDLDRLETAVQIELIKVWLIGFVTMTAAVFLGTLLAHLLLRNWDSMAKQANRVRITIAPDDDAPPMLTPDEAQRRGPPPPPPARR